MNEEAVPNAAAAALEEAERLIKGGDYASAREMCEKLLANPVIEQFTFEVNEVWAAR